MRRLVRHCPAARRRNLRCSQLRDNAWQLRARGDKHHWQAAAPGAAAGVRAGPHVTLRRAGPHASPDTPILQIDTYNHMWAFEGIGWAAADLEANDQILRIQPVGGGTIALLAVLRGSDRLGARPASVEGVGCR